MIEAGTILAMDFGGTKLAAGVAERGGARLQDRALSPSSSPKSAQRDLDTMSEMCDRLLEGRALLAVGVSFGGPVDIRTGIVLTSHHVPGWNNYPLKQTLEARYGVPVAIENDVNIAARGEWAYGAGRGFQNVFYVNVGTGVGGGLVLGGRPYGGVTGVAGEIGHTVIRSDGPVCTCGRRGCVESLAAGPYIALAARERLEADPKQGSKLLDLAEGDPARITTKMVSEAAELGDVLARGVLVDAASALGLGIANAVNLLNPECVILGGGVTKAGDVYWQTVRRVAVENVLPGTMINIVPAGLGDDAPLWGGIHLAEEAMQASHGAGIGGDGSVEG